MKRCACVSMIWLRSQCTQALRAPLDTLVHKVLLDLRAAMAPLVSLGHKDIPAPLDLPEKTDM